MANTSPLLGLEFVYLNNGQTMPTVGLGTYQGTADLSADHNAVLSSLRSAIEIGYRHIDTSCDYNTEECIGEVTRQKIENKLISREDIFVTTKLWSTCHRKELVVPALKKSLSKLGLDKVDMFLIHLPFALMPSEDWIPTNEHGEIMFDDESNITDTWQGMEECVREGLAKSIGVSNFNIDQIKRILNSCTIRPANNQIEVHPYYSNVELVNFCKEQDIVVVGYTPLGLPYRSWAKEGEPCIFTDPTLKKIAAKHKKSVAQVALRFQIQRGIVVIPKSNSPERQRENLDIFNFSLSYEEMEMIYKCNKDFHVYAPMLKPLKASKEFPFTDM